MSYAHNLEADDIEAYLAKSGLHADESLIAVALEQMDRIDDYRGQPPESEEQFWTYQVPKLSADGSCSLIEELDESPFDLRTVINDSSKRDILMLRQCEALLRAASSRISCDWLGIYKRFSTAEEDKLVKLRYMGLESRAEFPLTAEFALKSNNSKVAISGKSVLIADIEQHQGPYYQCDTKVRSELCLPIFGPVTSSGQPKVIGIIDAEDHRKGYFDPEKVSYAAALCIILSSVL